MWLFSRRALVLSLQDLSALNEFSVFCYRYFSVIFVWAANLTFRLSGSQSNPSSLLRISAKNREEYLSISLASCLTMSIYDFKTFIHDLVDFTAFLFTAFSSSSCISSPEISEKLAAIFVENKRKNVIVFSVFMSTLLYHPAFAVIPLLRGNSDANNQSNLPKFLGLHYKDRISRDRSGRSFTTETY